MGSCWVREEVSEHQISLTWLQDMAEEQICLPEGKTSLAIGGGNLAFGSELEKTATCQMAWSRLGSQCGYVPT